MPPGSDGPAQPAKSTWDEHYRLVIILLKVKMSLISAKNRGGGRGGGAFGDCPLVPTVLHNQLRAHEMSIIDERS